MFKMEIKTGGEAFRDPCTGTESRYWEVREVARLLRKYANDVEDGKMEGSIMDLNGNKVGKWHLD